MLKEYFSETVRKSTDELIAEGNLGAMQPQDQYYLSVEIPKNPQFGDFAVNVASLSRYTKLSPSQTAKLISENIHASDFDVNVTAGFINFKLHKPMLNSVLEEILTRKNNYAKNNLGNGEKVLIEYVSANPTGPFHIGHGRWAAVGSALANIMIFSGYDVSQEFYINDAGSQIQKLGKSLYIRILQQTGVEIDFPADEENAKNFYTGDFLIPVAKDYINENKAEAQNIKDSFNGEFDAEILKKLSRYARLKMLELQQKLLENFNTRFDKFFSELTLHESGKVEACIKKLNEKGVLYEKDNALWFASSKYGDDQDRVIKKTDGSYTYLTADIAYHYDKFQRGFERLINIWGADHHGYIPRMRAAVEVLGYSPDCLEVLLGQLVNIVMNGEQMRMGKRTKMVTLDELIEEVGIDATRFWMIMRSIDTTLDFDVELAKSKTDENPVFYVQYAHARACSILRHAVSEKFDVLNKITISASTDNPDDKIFNLKASDFDCLWDKNDEKSQLTIKKLILKLEEFKFVVQNAAKNRTPYLITKYLQELSADFHRFYQACKVISDDEKLMLSGLALVKSVIIILQSALKLIAISAPEKM